jgi:predicted TIM-barrel fold metal-dependent hydrolase
MISEVGPERLMWGSDYPFYPEAVLLARLLVATGDDIDLCRLILSENAKRFWGVNT